MSNPRSQQALLSGFSTVVNGNVPALMDFLMTDCGVTGARVANVIKNHPAMQKTCSNGVVPPANEADLANQVRATFALLSASHAESALLGRNFWSANGALPEAPELIDSRALDCMLDFQEALEAMLSGYGLTAFVKPGGLSLLPELRKDWAVRNVNSMSLLPELPNQWPDPSVMGV